MRAWIDPHWYEGDGMTVVHSDDVDEARNLLGMDEGSMPERCEAMDDLDGHSMEGVGMFCSEECWRQSPWNKRP